MTGKKKILALFMGLIMILGMLTPGASNVFAEEAENETILIAVPDLAGMTENEAVEAISALDLLPGEVNEEYDEAIPSGQVISQNPLAGTEVEPGSSVDIVVSMGFAPVQEEEEEKEEEENKEIQNQALYQGYVCEIEEAQYASLDDALAEVQDGQTIRLLDNIDYYDGISINDKEITLDLSGFTLNVENGSGGGLLVENNGVVNLTGDGEFNVSGTDYGVKAMTGGTATVTNATATGDYGTGAYASSSGRVVVGGNATAEGYNGYGAYACSGGSVVVEGNATVERDGGYGAYAAHSGSITVRGNATAAGYAHHVEEIYDDEGECSEIVEYFYGGKGAYAGFQGSVTVDGNATAVGNDYGYAPQAGAYAEYNGSIIVGGNATTTAGGGYYSSFENPCGAVASFGGSVTVRGNATVEGYNGIGAYAITGGSVVVGGNASAEEEYGGYGVSAYHEGSSVTVGGNATGYYGAYAYDGGSVVVEGNAVGAIYGASAWGTSYGMSGGSVVVGGNATATGDYGYGASAYYDGSVTVGGNAAAEGDNGYGAWAYYHGSVTVGGNATAVGNNGYGAHATARGSVTVKGNATAEGDNGYGAYAFNRGSVIVGGNVMAAGDNGIGAQASSHASNGGSITVDGSITASIYIKIGNVEKGEHDYEIETTKPGYLTYTDGTSTVWVKVAEAGYICEIEGGPQYTALDEALAAVQDGQTIRLLNSIHYNGCISISSKQITLNLNNFTLNVVNSLGGGLLVENNGAVNLTGDGEFNVTGRNYGVKAMTGGTAAVTNATATGYSGCGVYAEDGGSSVTVGGNATATGDYGTGAYASSSGRVVVGGNATATEAHGTGAYAAHGGNLTVGGNTTAEGSRGKGAVAKSGGSVVVEGNTTASGMSGEGAYAEGDGSSVIVRGNATATGNGGRGADAESGGSVIVEGNATATGFGDGYGAFARNGGSIVVEGNAEATKTGFFINRYGVLARDGGRVVVKGNVSATGDRAVGAHAWLSCITVDGSITASVYIKAGNDEKGKNDYETETTKLGYLTYTDGTSTVWVKAAVYNVSVSANPTEGGTVTGGGAYAQGASVILSAAANSGYNFINWTEGSTVISTDATYSFTMGSADRTLAANFEQKVPLIPPTPETLPLSYVTLNMTGSPVKLNGIQDSAVDSAGNLYVIDFNNHRVVKFDSSGRYINGYGIFGNSSGQFNKPVGIAIDSADNIFVADSSNNRIVRFKDADGDGTIDEWQAYGGTAAGTGTMEFNRPLGVFVKDETIYVADTHNNRIAVFDISGDTGSWKAYGSRGSAAGQYNMPYDLAVDQQGNIWVSDTLNKRVQKLDANGQNPEVYSAPAYDFTFGIAVDIYGNVFVAERQTGYIKCVNNPVTFGGKGNTAGTFRSPIGLNVDSQNRLWVVDVTSGRIQSAPVGY